MNKLHVAGILFVLGVAACTTAQVQQSCVEAQDLLTKATPYEAVAPVEVRTGLALLRTGSVVCQSPQYAAIRDQVTAWLNRTR